MRVFSWDGSGWFQLGSDLLGEFSEDEYGIGLSLNAAGDIVAIGSVNQSEMGELAAGETSVFKWNGSSWNQLGADIDGGYGEASGRACQLDDEGNSIVIGFPYNDNDGGGNAGAVRVFDWTGDGWVQRGEDIIGTSFGENSGSSVTINADGTIVGFGAPNNAEVADYSGEVRVYKWQDELWTQIGEDLSGTVIFDKFGLSVQLNAAGDILAVGAPWSLDGPPTECWAGVYQFEDLEWTLIDEKIVGSETVDLTGYDVALNGVGDVFGVSTTLPDTGYVRIYSTFIEIDNNGISQVDNDAQIRAYPNPVLDDLVVKLPSVYGNLNITVKNLHGQDLLFQTEIMVSDFQINTKNLPSGIYLLIIEADGQEFMPYKFTHY